MKILSRSFYAEILALQGFPAGLRDSYFIRDKPDYSEIQDNQTFSGAGARRGFSDPRGTLFFEIARLVEARHPAYLILENVPGLLNHSRGETYATILNTLDRLGYGVEWQCLNSKDFGVPQSRNRVYIVGYLDERCRGKVFPFLETAGGSLIQTHGGHQGERVYSPEGLSCTLAANPGGFGGKTGLYEVGVPIKCATKTGYQMAQVGDSIDLSYATVIQTITCHGRDDYAVWNVEIPSDMFRSIVREAAEKVGTLEELMDSMDAATGCEMRLLTQMKDGRFAFFAIPERMNDLRDYETQGSSTRGSKEQIMAEIFTDWEPTEESEDELDR